MEREAVFFDIEGTECCDDEKALAYLLLDGVLFCNERNYIWSLRGQTETSGPTTVLFVICNDVFAWGCADAEDLPRDQIGTLYKMHEADPVWGSTRWCCIRRKEKPQKPVMEKMMEEGAWDEVLEALPENETDAKVHAAFVQAREELFDAEPKP